MKRVILFLLISSFCHISWCATKIVFRVDDFELRDLKKQNDIIASFEKHNIPLCIGIIPFKDSYYMPDSIKRHWQMLIKEGKLEIALHGYKHIADGNKGEFRDVPLYEQYKRIKAGKCFLDSMLNIDTYIFIPPWNKYDRNTVSALQFSDIPVLSANWLEDTSTKKSTHYIPATSEEFLGLESSINSPSFWAEGTVVILFHPYSFTTNFSFERLDKLLSNLSQSSLFEVTTFHQCLKENISMERNLNRNPVLRAFFIDCVSLEKCNLLLMLDSFLLALLAAVLFLVGCRPLNSKVSCCALILFILVFIFLQQVHLGYYKVILSVAVITVVSILAWKVRKSDV